MKTLPLALVLASAATMQIRGEQPLKAEFLARDAWRDEWLQAPQLRGASPHLTIAFEDVADGITRGKSWRGTPFQLGDKTYTHGLAFNSTKHLQVHLGRPAKRLTADIGLENNDDTRRGEALGQGSVRFHVLAGSKELFTSPVMRRKDGPRSIAIELEGATDFEIRVTDAGDGRGWDQALWAEGEIWLSDGGNLRLQDLPLNPATPLNPFVFSFVCNGTNSSTLLRNWTRKTAGPHSVSFNDGSTGLEARVDSTSFDDFPAIEWVVHFTNKGSNNTPLLERIQALDTELPVSASAEPILHWNKGGVASFDDFQPQDSVLKPGAKLRLQPGGGRSSSQVLPFFNIEGASGGVIAAIGWTGEWAAEFVADERHRVSMRAGMELTHLVLHPSESIRTPRMLLLFYQGDRWHGQNLLRQFVLKHHRPTRSGEPLIAPVTCGNWGGTAAAVHLDNIQQIIRHELPIEYYWIDAEWFGQGGWPVNVGTWETKKDLYPSGFSPLSEALRKSRRELMLWFEPERVHKGTSWYKEHHDWLLDPGGDDALLNLGNPAARSFLTDFISKKITEFGLGCYRQDFNIDPLRFWRAADAPDRQGITEIRYIEGLYAFWDELLKRHPGLIIDNCASGGRRLDIETTGRATPFWRTDGPRDPIAHQCHTVGLLPWLPLSSTSQDHAQDNYEFRSSMCSGLCLNWWVSGDAPAERIPADFPFEWAKATLDQYLEFRKFYYGDFYPLTEYSQAPTAWVVYQLDRSDLGAGLIVALRRPGSPYEAARFPLRGLEPKAIYEVTNLDSKEQTVRSGAELAKEGLSIRLAARPDSSLFLYRRPGGS